MYPYPIAVNELERLEDLYSLDILDTPEEEEYNCLVELASFVTGCPSTAISLIDKDRQWIKAKKGIDIQETPRQVAICAHTIVHGKLMIIEDTINDLRFMDNPFVHTTDGIRFYAGVPIYSPGGHAMGTVCATDMKPRKLTAQQREALNAIATQASKLLELRKKAKLVYTQTQKLLELEKLTLQYQIKQQQEENEIVGSELHENIAQTLTAAINTLQLSETLPISKEDVMNRVKKILENVLGNIRQLSNAINPTDNLNVGSEEKLNRLCNEFSESFGCTVVLKCNGDLDQLKPEQLSHLFRIISEHLHSYEQEDGRGQNIYIQINIGLEIDLQIFAGNDINYLTEKRMIMFNSIKHRCEMMQGSACLDRVGLKTSLLKVQIPLT